MVGGGKLTAAQCNQSHQDQIWKDYVCKEESIGKKWTDTWGFLRDEYSTLSRDLGQIRASEPLKLPRLQAPKQNTSNPFPMVSSREVGWRSGKRECRLEIYGRWGRPKYSIIKQLRWPNDAVP
ncbi:ciliary microtubule inner protein 1-like [Halichondria panicea]|uniref:ciliary microtubule inner protein 1-like n=1 Tax=Halichondria panicea TaxID=6063 RepID=UPI00312B5BFB